MNRNDNDSGSEFKSRVLALERRPRRPDEHLGDLCSVREDPMFAVTSEDLNASQRAVQSANVMY
jgi:hypothetical protein